MTPFASQVTIKKKKVYQAPKSFQSVADYNIIWNNNRIHLLTQEEEHSTLFLSRTSSFVERYGEPTTCWGQLFLGGNSPHAHRRVCVCCLFWYCRFLESFFCMLIYSKHFLFLKLSHLGSVWSWQRFHLHISRLGPSSRSRRLHRVSLEKNNKKINIFWMIRRDSLLRSCFYNVCWYQTDHWPMGGRAGRRHCLITGVAQWFSIGICCFRLKKKVLRV